MSSLQFSKIKEDLHELSVYEVILFGSVAKDENNCRSDIDIAIISRCGERKKNIKIWEKLLGTMPPEYDIKVFELLPLEIQHSIITSYKVVFGNALEISEYLYQYRKRWQEMRFRYLANQHSSISEKIFCLNRAHEAGLLKP